MESLQQCKCSWQSVSVRIKERAFRAPQDREIDPFCYMLRNGGYFHILAGSVLQ